MIFTFKKNLAVYILTLFILTFFACNKVGTLQRNKTDVDKNALGSRSINLLSSSNNYGYPYSYGIIDSFPSTDYDGDSIERPTILGHQRNNPYTIPLMQQAYRNVGLPQITVSATNQYVKFLPNSIDQLITLDSLLDVQGLEIFDAPMDYDVLQEGEYYQDPNVPDEQVTYQYAVVPTNFQFPSGISYQVLAQIHIPGDNYTAVETEAERLAAIQDSLDANGGGNLVARPNGIICASGFHWDTDVQRCVANSCPPGYTWNGSQCVAPPPPPPPSPNPPPPSPDAQNPAGYIKVQDVNIGSTPGVRNIRIVAKRWFKIDRFYTDNNGYFQSSKRFKHKVKINVKFKNDYAKIRGLRGIRIWQMIWPIKKTIGVYKGTKNNIVYTFNQYSTGGNFSNDKGNRYWVGATDFNAIQEQKDYASQFGFAAPPSGLNVFITNWGITSGLASTPLFNKRYSSDINSSFVNTFLTGLGNFNSGPVLALLSRLRLDLAIDYHTNSISLFTSDRLKETIYHELCHASDYSQVGNGWYSSFVNAELAEGVKHPSGMYNPYGDGVSSNSPIIALGEAWGYHMGYFLANQKYNVEQSPAKGDANVVIQNGNFNTGMDGVSLEYFTPGLGTDPFRWIPEGIMLDLMDPSEPNFTSVNDQVSGYTIQQIFAALQPDISTLQQYRDRLLQQNSYNQQTQVITLFQSYGYQ